VKWQGKCGTVSAAFTCTGRPADPCYKLLYPGGELLREKADFYRNEMEEEREEALQAA